MSILIKIPNLPDQAERLYDVQTDPNFTGFTTLPGIKEQIISLNWAKLYAAIQANNVDTFTGFFRNYSKLQSVDVKNWNVSAVINMAYMFADCAAITELDLSGWNTSSCEEMDGFVSGCDALTKIWAPSTFVATQAATKPFELGTYGSQCHIYTNAASDADVNWGTIDSGFTVHWGSTYNDFLNA